MRRFLFAGFLLLAIVAIAAVWAAGGNTLETYESNDPVWTRPVTVSNFPNPQNVAGTVDVGNLPAVQSVEVINFPPTAAPARFQFVGFTTATLAGNSGLFGLTEACQSEFPGSRFCTLEEIGTTTAIPAGLVDPWPTGRAWVWVGANGGDVFYTGRSADCGGWMEDYSGVNGLTMDGAGRYSMRGCNVPNPVACCSPVE